MTEATHNTLNIFELGTSRMLPDNRLQRTVRCAVGPWIEALDSRREKILVGSRVNSRG